MKKPRLTVALSKKEQGWGLCYLAAELFVLPSLLSRLFPPLLANCVWYGLNFAAVLLIFSRFLKKSLEQVGKKPERFLGALALGLLAYLACAKGIDWLYGYIDPSLVNVNDASITGIFRGHRALLVICTVLLAPTAEECLYRGVVFRGLWNRSRFAAYAVSALLFCAVHVAGFVGQVPAHTLALCFLQYLPAGLILAYSYRLGDSIFVPILIHTAANILAIAAMR